MKVKLLFILLVQLVTVSLGQSVLRLNQGKDSVETSEFNGQLEENGIMKTLETFHRRYHYPTYYRQPATGYYNRPTYANRYESLRKEFANNDDYVDFLLYLLDR